MSKIDKLAILGVRSFDNTRSETIAFHTPLTLIVGYNGSGKTTIIECLKYATTGDMPPNSKNGAFIHDPKMCGEKEVLAQVKLSFQNTNGAKMVCTRSLQLTVKKTTRTQKTLEGQLLVLKDGQRSSVSSRCAELDQMLPNFLGVPKAILDSVIFCHQEESMWPLSEPSALKKKFDEIFEAQKYTKAIDNIKALRKKQTDELKTLNAIQVQFKQDKERSEKAERRARSLEAQIETQREEVDEVTKQIEETMKHLQELSASASGFENIIDRLRTARENAVKQREFIEDLSHDIHILSNTDEELEEIQSQYGERMENTRKNMETKRTEQRNLKDSLLVSGRQLNEKMDLRGQLIAERDAHSRQLSLREEMVKNASSRHNIRGFNTGDLDEMQISEFLQKIEKLSRDQSNGLEKAKRDYREEHNAAMSERNTLENRKVTLLHSRDQLRKDIRRSEDQIRSFQKQYDQCDIDEGQITILETKLSDIKKNLERLEQIKRDSNLDEKLRTKIVELHDIEDKISRETKELARGNEQAQSKAALAYQKKELDAKQSALKSLEIAHTDKISQIIGTDWNITTLHEQYQQTLEDHELDVVEASRLHEASSRELSQIEREIKLNNESLKKKEKERDDAYEQVMQALRAAREKKPVVVKYPNKVAELEENLQLAKTDLATVSQRHAMAERTIKVAKEKKCCRLCQRGYNDENDLSNFIQRMENESKKASKEAVEKEITMYEEMLRSLKDSSGAYELYMRLKDVELPHIIAEVDKLRTKKEGLVDIYDKRQKVLDEKTALKLDAEAIKYTVSEMTKYSKESTDHQRNISKIMTELESFGQVRTTDDIQSSLQQLSEQASRLRTEREDIQAKRESQGQEMAALMKKSQDHDMEITNARHKFEQKTSISQRIEECQVLIKSKKEEMKTAEEQLLSLEPQIAKQKANTDDIQLKWTKKESELSKIVTSLSDTIRGLHAIEGEVAAYEQKRVPAQLERLTSEIDSLRKHITDSQEQIDLIGEDINKIEKERSDFEKHKRNIADNLRLRRNKRDLEANEKDIAELEAKNAEADHRKLIKEHHKAQTKHNHLTAEKATKVATMAVLDRQLAELINDWETDYKDAHKKFHEGQIKVKTTGAAIDDLGKYQNALDKAVMKYHSLKMEEVNRIVDDLWKRTYKGTDVDTILIRSEQENAKGNRLYNYRVCMVKQDAELDMRGRCSAGQKVLASIIIRLALAECFGTNCGLIALDEPTTNLDRDNSRALAQSLHEIIQYRSAQKNFQLIVITHDEEFLRYMKCNQFTEYYYRVSRNERQKSIIERQSIAEVER